MKEAAKKLLYLNKTYYKNGDEADRLLALKLRMVATWKEFKAIQNEESQLMQETSEIRAVFQWYYSILFHLQELDEQLQDVYLRVYKPPCLAKEMHLLEEDISVEIVRPAINRLLDRKSPGPEGITTSFL